MLWNRRRFWDRLSGLVKHSIWFLVESCLPNLKMILIDVTEQAHPIFAEMPCLFEFSFKKKKALINSLGPVFHMSTLEPLLVKKVFLCSTAKFSSLLSFT